MANWASFNKKIILTSHDDARKQSKECRNRVKANVDTADGCHHQRGIDLKKKISDKKTGYSKF